METVNFLVRLYRWVKRNQPAIIHADTPRLAHFAALVKGKAKLVMHLRVADHDGFSDALLAGETDAMIAISIGVADRFRRYPRRIRDHVHIVYNGVDTKVFTPLDSESRRRIRRELHLPARGKLATLLAAFVPVKRQELAVRLWAEVNKHTDAHLVMAGDGNPEYLRKVNSLIDEFDLGKKITLLAPTDAPQELLASADLNLLTSDENEGFGRVIIEAAACGVPSVAVDIPGVREIILPGVTGHLLTARHSLPEWGVQIADLLTDNKRRRDLGEKALQFVRERFASEKHVQGITMVYESLLNRGGSS
jgi:glycosyltransferase involved in cell wall biosynthesis